MRFIPFLLAICFTSCSTVPELPKNTPLTKAGYTKALEDHLGTIWHRLMAANVARVSVGTVKLTFRIPAAGGRPYNIQTISNSAAPANDQVARAAIKRLMAPPVPAAVLERIDEKNFLPFEESFTTFANSQPAPTAQKR